MTENVRQQQAEFDAAPGMRTTSLSSSTLSCGSACTAFQPSQDAPGPELRPPPASELASLHRCPCCGTTPIIPADLLNVALATLSSQNLERPSAHAGVGLAPRHAAALPHSPHLIHPSAITPWSPALNAAVDGTGTIGDPGDPLPRPDQMELPDRPPGLYCPAEAYARDHAAWLAGLTDGERAHTRRVEQYLEWLGTPEDQHLNVVEQAEGARMAAFGVHGPLFRRLERNATETAPWAPRQHTMAQARPALNQPAQATCAEAPLPSRNNSPQRPRPPVLTVHLDVPGWSPLEEAMEQEDSPVEMALLQAIQQRNAVFNADARRRERAQSRARAASLVEMMVDAEEWAMQHSPRGDRIVNSRGANPASSKRHEQRILRGKFWVHDACVICLNGVPEVGYSPCQHLVVCVGCQKQMGLNEQCPICRADVLEYGFLPAPAESVAGT
ncbi:hypothetical protein WJX84_006476 [Apatococcus fuscideae]|uniref:RING-type domain-containing protein n=1 Tax=Apatococcus fuscideae TaxID=2026836 RepID=A0AAW1T1N5_9CHLO